MPSIIEFHDCCDSSEVNLTYVIIGARYRDDWVFVKSRKRGSYELPAGHIKENELAEDAAARELKEETGAVRFSIECVNIYSVTEGSETGWGELFFAEIHDLGEIEDRNEIEEVIFSKKIPENLTFPRIQITLFTRLLKYLAGKSKNFTKDL
ncbi:MAG: NUDIX domain-containing protein [Bacteroidales bacterium]|nr:NUDIX domain-containing protein [Bacteroidales bacterium]